MADDDSDGEPCRRLKAAERYEWLLAVTKDARLTPACSRVANLLALQYLNRLTGEAFPSQERLALDLTASLRTVENAVTQLRMMGYLVATKRGRSNHYAMSLPLKYPKKSSGISNLDKTRTEGGQKADTRKNLRVNTRKNLRSNPGSRTLKRDGLQPSPTSLPSESVSHIDENEVDDWPLPYDRSPEPWGD